MQNPLRGRRKTVKGKKLIFSRNLYTMIAWLLIVCCDSPGYLQLNSWTRCTRPADLGRNLLGVWNNSWKCCSNPCQNSTLILLQGLKTYILLEPLGVFKTVDLGRLSKVLQFFWIFHSFEVSSFKWTSREQEKGWQWLHCVIPYEHP